MKSSLLVPKKGEKTGAVEGIKQRDSLDEDEKIVALTFMVPKSLAREFKKFAVNHDYKMRELFKLSFDAVKEKFS